MNNLTWGDAFQAAKTKGVEIARQGWNGKGMFAYYVPAAVYPAATGSAKKHFPDGNVPYRAYLAFVDAQGTCGTWVPSMADLDAEDWFILSDVNPLVNAAIPQNQPVPTSNLEVLMEAGKLIFGYWWKPADPVKDTEIPIMMDGGDMRNRFIEAAEKFGGFNLSANAALKCRTVGEILELIH